MNSSGNEPETVDLRTLTAHTESVAAVATVEAVQAVLAKKNVDFIAVLDGTRLCGVCARREVMQHLSSRYGFALNARQPVQGFLMAQPLMVTVVTPITEVFKAASARDPHELFDDVVLVDSDGKYVGMIPMSTLVRLQTDFLLQNNARLEASREEIAAKNRAMEADLLMAREVQLAMLPQTPAPERAGGAELRIASRFQPASGVSGDFFDVLRIADGQVGILVCDVMGHGVRSALITAMVRALLEQLREVADRPGVLMTRLNRDLTHILRQTGSLIFVTAAYAMIDVGTRKLRYAQAGHPTPLRWNAQTRTVGPMECPPEVAGPGLGLIDDFEYTASEAEFGEGDRLVLFTDGLFEAANAEGTEYGLERLAMQAGETATQPLETALQSMVASVTAFTAGAVFADDVCLIAAELVRSSARL